MSLPKLLTPEFETVIPSSKEPIRFRPFLVKEEKILYMALESNNQKDIFNSIIKILESCILTPGINYEKLTSYDLEYLFLMLRSKSVGEIIKVKLKHHDKNFAEKCDHSTEVQINIDNIKVKYSDNHHNNIKLTEDVGLKLKEPKASLLTSNSTNENQLDSIMSIIYSCIECVYDKDSVYNEFTLQELKDFIDSLNKEQFQKIVDFFNTIPKLSHEVSFKCEKCGESENITIEGLQSFFT